MIRTKGVKRTVRVTWVDSEGNATCLGLDETFQINPLLTSLADVRADAEYRGACNGVDPKKHRPTAEFIDDGAPTVTWIESENPKPRCSKCGTPKSYDMFKGEYCTRCNDWC